MPSRSNKTWLIPLVQSVWDQTAPADPAPATGFADAADFERWLSAELGRRGYHAGLPRDLLHSLGEGYAEVRFAEFTTLNTEAHRLQLGLQILRRIGLGREVRHDALLLFAALGHALERADLADQALQALEDEEDDAGTAEARSRRRSDLAAALGAAIDARALSADDPLLGHPFHEVLIYHDAQLFGRLVRVVALARENPGGRPDPQALLAPLGHARAAEMQCISACIAIAAADGTLDVDERRLINALIRAAGLGEAEMAMFHAETERPESAADLAAEITDPTLRHFVLRLLLLTIHVNGQYHPDERRFFDALASRFGADPDMLQAYELDALANYEHHARLFGDLSLTSVVRRMRARMNERVEHAITSNATKLKDEIGETGELGQLLLKACDTPLTDEEWTKVRTQLTDVCRAIPALAIFAAPGGTLLLPLLIKHLPFNLLPSNFDKVDEL